MRLRRVNDCREYTIDARGTDIGRVRKFLFDDLTWSIRYIVVATSTILKGRAVLISPAALQKRAWSPLHIRVNLDWKQVESAPGIDLHRPVSRQREVEQHDHYGWAYYWEQEAGANTDAHLRSSEEVRGYRVSASDREIGLVEDFLFDDKNWKIRWAIIRTRGWWPGRQVLLSPKWIRRVSWRERAIHTNLSREQIKKSPAWNPHKPVSRKYELQLHKHYQLPPYWTSLPDAPRATANKRGSK